ncbi:MAG: response regulator [bacterium]
MDELKLLLVDDVELFLDLEKSFLNRKSFTIFTAKSGKEALDVVSRIKPDLVLVDLFMPDLNGDEVCRELKSKPETSNIPVIIASSDILEGVRERCYSAGCDGFISKPINRETLIATIEDNLQVAKRRFRRIPAHLLCSVKIDDTVVEGVVTTIAQMGAFVIISPPLEAGRSIELAIKLPETNKPVTTRAVVRWTASKTADSPEGAGVEFVALSEEDEDQIKDYVASRLRAMDPMKSLT